MADLDTAPKYDVVTDDTDVTATLISHFIDHSTIKSSGIREVSKAGFDAAMLSQGVSAVDIKKVQTALDAATSAAALVAASDLESKIGAGSKDDLANDEFRRGLSSTVRIPTPGGKTEVQVYAETVNNIPFRGDADGNGERQTKTTYGRIRTTVNAQARIHKDLPGSVTDRIRTSLGIVG